MEEVKTRRVATDENRWVLLLVYVLQYILMLTLSFWRLSAGAELWKSENSKASTGGRSVEQGEWGAWTRTVEHTGKTRFTRVLFEVIFVLDRQSDAWREELECGTRSKSWSVQRV